MNKTKSFTTISQLTNSQREVVGFIQSHHVISWKKSNVNRISVYDKNGSIIRTIKPQVIDKMVDKEIVLIKEDKYHQSIVLNQTMCQFLRNFEK
jgi:hypothetical protein